MKKFTKEQAMAFLSLMHKGGCYDSAFGDAEIHWSAEIGFASEKSDLENIWSEPTETEESKPVGVVVAEGYFGQAGRSISVFDADGTVVYSCDGEDAMELLDYAASADVGENSESFNPSGHRLFGIAKQYVS